MSNPWPMTVDSVLLRDATSVDVERMLTFRNDAEVNHFMLRTSVDPQVFRQNWLDIPASDTKFSCVADVRGEAVGMAFLDVVDGMGQPGVAKGTEALIGYILDPVHAGRGYATSITKGLMTAAFDRLGLRRVNAGCFADNLASVRVLEKAGLRLEQRGVKDSWHAELGWIDGCTYALLDTEWRSLSRT